MNHPAAQPSSVSLALSRSVSVRAFRVVADIGFARTREDLRAIAMLAQERGGLLTAEALRDALLPTLPLAASRRMLAVAVSLALFRAESKDVWRITAEGQRAADAGTVFVPERGTWTIWVTDDPLVPAGDRLLRVEPWRDDEARAQRQKKDAPRPLEPLPAWVHDAVRASSGTPGWSQDKSRALRVLELGKEAESIAATHALRLTATLSPERETTIALRGAIDEIRGERSFAAPAAMTFAAVWALALRERAREWDGRSLAVGFDELSDDGRARFRHALAVSLPQHREWASFDPAQVQDVAVRPRSAPDAQRWAEWLLLRATATYVTPAAFHAAWDAVARRFLEHRVAAPAQSELAARVRGNAKPGPRAYWYLQAPLDWGL